jgi:hypothetical protein
MAVLLTAPLLSEQDKMVHMLYAASRIDTPTDGNKLVYKAAYDEIHVDEKWFYITPLKERVHLSQQEIEEDLPKRKVKHKSHVLKVMFFADVARPRYKDGECVLDGKIGVWPIVEYVPAARASKNRPRGTIETKPLSVTKELYVDFLCNKLVPAVLSKWPRTTRGRHDVIPVGMQQDNPNTHMKTADPMWIETISRHPRFQFGIREQPPRSPDTNILDLGFFNSMQAQVWRLKRANNIDGLIANCLKAWEDYKPDTLNRIWCTHQAVMDEILKDGGGNDYKLPHVGKDRSEMYMVNFPTDWM